IPPAKIRYFKHDPVLPLNIRIPLYAGRTGSVTIAYGYCFAVGIQESGVRIQNGLGIPYRLNKLCGLTRL
ncbi:MAG: hypothetical protein M1609_13905, partial [Firmicutes bacterium]|nr:hypothetical protein [Bacillota bacterium]